ncbi:hypothetical protein [Ereboglobus sp. PH5-5]|uniref:hypothetical protein n=1 Tax=Ereboglobus sp. PH5-5 TaxID=2940529 RepID=UPI00240561BB|nr:hypothetical protein [Ereboglobus sp. PH5-5]
MLKFEYALPISENLNEFLYPCHLTFIEHDKSWTQIETIPKGLMKPVRKDYNPVDGSLGICVTSSYLKAQVLRAIEKYNYGEKHMKIKFRIRASNNLNETMMLDTEPILIEMKNNGLFLIGYWKTSKDGRYPTYSNVDKHTFDNLVKLDTPIEIKEVYKPTQWGLLPENWVVSVKFRTF